MKYYIFVIVRNKNTVKNENMLLLLICSI